MSTKHPFVSEDHEGKPWFEWLVFFLVLLSAGLAFLGYTMAATILLSVTAIVTGLLRLILRKKSPWKVRSVGFDAFIGIMLGIGLLVTYFSIRLLM